MRRTLTLAILALIAPLAIAQTPATHPPVTTNAPLSGAPVAGGHAALPIAPAGTAVTSTPLSPQDAAFLSQTSDLQRQVQVLTLQARIADLQKKINDAEHPPAPTAPEPLISEPPRPVSGSAATVVSSVHIPDHRAPASLRLVGVMEIGRAKQATIIDHGVPVRASVGSPLPSGWQVESIDSTAVVLVRGRAHRRLAIGD